MIDVGPGKRVLISGGTGFLGSAVTERFRDAGCEVVLLTRGVVRPGDDAVRWDPVAGKLDNAAIEGFDAVIHLAGEPISPIWTAKKKAAVMQSRRDGTALLADAVARLDRKPAAFVSAGAIGIYGDRGDELLHEDSGRGVGFLADVCDAWERAAQPARDVGVRVVNLRIGLVLGRGGGLLGPMLPVFRLGAGGRIGSGRQYWSWVALADVIGALLFAVEEPALTGPVNVVAPNPVTNAEFARTLGSVLRRPAVIPVPAFALQALAREAADEMLLAGQRVSCERLRHAGYEFAFSELKPALEAVVRR